MVRSKSCCSPPLAGQEIFLPLAIGICTAPFLVQSSMAKIPIQIGRREEEKVWASEQKKGVCTQCEPVKTMCTTLVSLIRTPRPS